MAMGWVALFGAACGDDGSSTTDAGTGRHDAGQFDGLPRHLRGEPIFTWRHIHFESPAFLRRKDFFEVLAGDRERVNHLLQFRVGLEFLPEQAICTSTVRVVGIAS